MADFRLTPEQARTALAEALESGRFVQARSTLRVRNLSETGGPVGGPEFRHCCLGVACQVFHELEGLGHWADESHFSTVEGVVDAPVDKEGQATTASSISLPVEVRRWLGFATDSGAFREGLSVAVPYREPGTTSLLGMNDLGLPFQDIAKVLRRGMVAQTGEKAVAVEY